jgi:carboxyl-terminal processing protease
MKKEILISSLITLISLAIAFLAGFFTHRFLHPPELEAPVLSQAKEIIKTHAYYPLPDDAMLEYGMIRGLVSTLEDPYAAFAEPAQHEIISDTFQGEFGGIGAQISRDEDGQILLYPLADSPARDAGVLDGDILVEVDSVAITSETDLDTAVALLRGPVGTRVSFSILRPSENDRINFTVRRQEFTLPSLTWRPLDNYPEIGLIDINVVAATTAAEVSAALAELTALGVTSLIIDLQGNGGGLLEGGIDTARLFLEEGEIITQQYQGQPIEVFSVNQPGPYSEIPLVILIDHGTASAAEIIAGALQAHARAVLIGAPSFGKNSIQLVFTLMDESSIQVTSALWWLEGGSPDQAFMLVPDIPAPAESDNYDQVIQLAVDHLLTGGN